MIGRLTGSSTMLRLLASVLLLLAMQTPAFGATLTVNSTADDNDASWGNGHDTLREAISYASSGDTIQLGTTGTITLTSTLPTVDKDLIIAGPGATSLTISGNDSYRVVLISSGTVSISGLTIEGGRLFSSGDTGAGVLVSGGTVAIDSCVIDGCTIPAGDSTGAAISIAEGATLNLTNSVATNNEAERGGAIMSYGVTNIANCTVSGNTSGVLGVGGGGVVYNSGGVMTVVSCTITNNTALHYEGGLLMCGGTTYLKNTIVAENIAPDGQGDVDLSSASGNLTSQGYNIVGVNDGPYSAFSPTTGDQTGTSASPVSPLVGALQDNGGPTPTHALLPGSPAIDAIPGCNDAPPTDQRGVARPQGSGCDIGAFEWQLFVAPTITSASATTFTVGSPGTFTVTSSGIPTVTAITYAGTLPAGVSFTDNGDGTATLAGTPATGTDETYALTLTATNGVAPDATQSFTLTVNPPPALTSDDTAVAESDGALSFEVTLSGAAAATVTVDWATVAGGTATAGVDYATSSGTLTFVVGDTSETAIVPVVDDLLDEFDETVFLQLSNPTGGATIAGGDTTGTILDDDPMPNLSAEGDDVIEGMTAVVWLALDAPSGLEVIVDDQTVDGTAMTGSDYLGDSDAVTIPAGETESRILITTLRDSAVEGEESFVVELANPSNAVLQTVSVSVSICDDDSGNCIFGDSFDTGTTSGWTSTQP